MTLGLLSSRSPKSASIYIVVLLWVPCERLVNKEGFRAKAWFGSFSSHVIQLRPTSGPPRNNTVCSWVFVVSTSAKRPKKGHKLVRTLEPGLCLCSPDQADFHKAHLDVRDLRWWREHLPTTPNYSLFPVSS